jgi:hypothetical protein
MAPFPSGTFVLDVELVSEADVKLIVTITVPGDKPQEMAAVPLRFLRTGADPSEKGELKLAVELKKKAVADSKGDKKGAVAGAAKKAGGSAVVGADKKSVQIDASAGGSAVVGSDAGEGGGKGHLGGVRMDTPMARSLAAKADLAERELIARSETVAAAKLERQQALEEEAARKAAQAQAAQAQAAAEQAAAARAERAEAKVAALASRSNLSAEMKAELSALREAAAEERAHADLAMAEAAAAAKAARELAGAAAREEEVPMKAEALMTSDDL